MLLSYGFFLCRWRRRVLIRRRFEVVIATMLLHTYLLLVRTTDRRRRRLDARAVRSIDERSTFFPVYFIIIVSLATPTSSSPMTRVLLMLYLKPTVERGERDKAKNNEVEARLYIILLSNKIFFNNFNNIPVAVTMYFCFVISMSVVLRSIV